MRNAGCTLFAALMLLVLASLSPLLIDATGGMAVGRDPDGVTQRVELRGSQSRKSMTELPFGTYVARPSFDGTIAFTCRNGKVVERGYVTVHLTTIEVIRESDCAQTSSTSRP